MEKFSYLQPSQLYSQVQGAFALRTSFVSRGLKSLHLRIACKYLLLGSDGIGVVTIFTTEVIVALATALIGPFAGAVV